MKPPKFHMGQAVVCIKTGNWVSDQLGAYPIPKKGGVYHIREIKYNPIWDDHWLIFSEFTGQHGYLQEHFIPVEMLTAQALAQLLEETLTLQPA